MANPEHVEIVKQGADAIRAWREKNPGVRLDLVRADLSEADLREANLSEAELSRADLTWAALADANLFRAILSGADLTLADLSRANLSRINLREANLRRAYLIGATLTAADLLGAALTASDLSGADLSAVNLIGAKLLRVNLCGANLAKALCGGTVFGDVDLSEVKGLDTVWHGAPSTLGIDTLFRSKGKIPEVFLRGCGVPDILIQYLPSLIQEPLQYCSCFIAFAETDNAFSERLYNDLQARGIRCWRWKEDAPWGRTLMREIDKAVRFYDKLIVICSEASLNSPAVLREIERALQKEDDLKRQGRDAEVLFPIRLDEYVFTGWEHHRKADVTAKNVGDFRDWQSAASYKKALDRLARDLQAQPEERAKT